MKSIVPICTGLVLLSAVGSYSKTADPVGPVIDGYRVTAATDKKTYSNAEKVHFVLTVRNMAASKACVTFGNDFSYFQVTVLGPDNKPVGYTTYGHEVFDSLLGGSAFLQTLDQGAERYIKNDINDYYDMSVPGRYKIFASRRLPRRNTSDQYVVVTSNHVVILITTSRGRMSPAPAPRRG